MSATNIRKTTKIFISSILCAHYAVAITSLYIPGFDPQPVTANELGVGSDGETTWLIAPGVSSGTLDDSGFYGPATLVLGPSAAVLTYIDPVYGIALYENCAIADGVAACTDIAVMSSATDVPGYTTTEFVTESAVGFAVQGGSATATAAPGSNSPNSPSATPSAGSSAGSAPVPSDGTSPASAGTGSPVPSSTGTAGSSSAKANGAMGLKSLPSLGFAIAGSVAAYVILC